MKVFVLLISNRPKTHIQPTLNAAAHITKLVVCNKKHNYVSVSRKAL
jgi:hypothetical protein